MMELQNEEEKRKLPKKGIVYLSTIPPYMNVTRIREVFEKYGSVGRIFLQPTEAEPSSNSTKNIKKTRKKYSKRFAEGWIEFQRKHVAKSVCALLNNTQVDSRKNSKHYDCIWNLKYLSHFKWAHLNERLSYEKAMRKQKLQTEIAQAKKQNTYFNLNVQKSAKLKNTTYPNTVFNMKTNNKFNIEISETETDRRTFLKDLFDT